MRPRLLGLFLLLAACPKPAPVVQKPEATTMPATVPAPQNPLLVDWTGPHGGLPPFDKVRLEDFKPGVEQALADALAEVERIAANPEPPTFDNTLAALERVNQRLERTLAIYHVWSGAKKTPEFQAIEEEIEPRLAAYNDAVVQNAKLFGRIEAIYAAKDQLTPEQARLAWKVDTDFVLAGARLDAAAKARLAEINQELAKLGTSFENNVLHDEADGLVLESQADLAGLPPTLVAAAAAEAAARKLEGKWVIRNTRSAVAPFLTFSDRRDLREKAYRMFVDRGDHPGEFDNNPIITKILALRAERAKLLGFETFAHWKLADTMAKTPQAALALLEQVWKPAAARVREEVADMQKLADKEAGKGKKIKIEPWDYRYYMEKVRKAKYDLDENALKPYLQLEKLREGMFYVAGELLNLEFKPLEGVAVFDPDVRVYLVSDKSSGAEVGLWYFDPYARDGKRSGAWMSEYRTQSRLDGATLPIVSNNANFLKGEPGKPVLISWDDAETMFHEFGHALHGLSSSVTYPSLAGTNVVRDYVELPSQILEHWLSTPEVLEKFAVHHETGAPMPKALVDKIHQTATFNQGFATVEFVASAIVDMKYHLAGAQAIDADAFERETLAALGMPAEIVMRHRSPQFLHIFGGDGYAAGYYSYLWADVLVADGYAAFTEAGGPFDKAVAQRLRENVFSVGNTVDPGEGYRKFRGRDAKVDALMKDRGFPTSAPAKPGK